MQSGQQALAWGWERAFSISGSGMPEVGRSSVRVTSFTGFAEQPHLRGRRGGPAWTAALCEGGPSLGRQQRLQPGLQNPQSHRRPGKAVFPDSNSVCTRKGVRKADRGRRGAPGSGGTRPGKAPSRRSRERGRKRAGPALLTTRLLPGAAHGRPHAAGQEQEAHGSAVPSRPGAHE